MSERITFTAEDAQLQILEAVEQRADIDSTAGAVRACITESARLQKEVKALQHCRARDREQHEAELETLEAELETRIEQLRGDLRHERARADELQGMLKAAHRRTDEVEAVVEYVEGREGVVGRAKAWLFGRE
jgi:DNA repair exonuclease SbcCD ATPase subunit